MKFPILSIDGSKADSIEISDKLVTFIWPMCLVSVLFNLVNLKICDKQNILLNSKSVLVAMK